MNFRIPRHFAPQLRDLIENGETLDDAIASLKSRGASITECIIAVKEHARCDLADAKQKINHCPAWRDVVEATNRDWEQLQDSDDK